MQDMCEGLEMLSGSVESISFRNEENGFSVLELNNGEELVTVVGILPFVAEGETLELRGSYQTHPNFGVQFKAAQCERSMPATAAAILHYLSSGAVKGVGPATARRLVEAFGADTLEILSHQPERLTSIKGITTAKAAKICEEYQRQFGIREVMLHLGQFNITPDEALKIYQTLGAAAAERVRNNPYILCSEELRFSFERADIVARELGMTENCAERVQAGIMHILRHNLGNGHTCLPKDKLLSAAQSMLSSADCRENLEIMISRGSLIAMPADENMIYLPSLYKAESFTANRLALMLKYPPEPIMMLESELQSIENENGVNYQELQREAIKAALYQGVLILTGGPGTGKTTTLNAIIKLLLSRGQKLALCAPTGRAAKRMSELTGEEAKTIHRLLEVDWSKGNKLSFQRCEQNPLDCDAVIVDELSMVDTQLIESLLRALKLGCRLIMVGDSDQLPSVGPGNVLHDLIASEKLPVIRLKEIFRQAMQSLIVQNAHKIVLGEYPELTVKDSDFFFMKRVNLISAQNTISQLYCERLPSAYGYNPLTDIQILCPSRKRALGTGNINNMLQQNLNPPSPEKKEITRLSFVLREGDKVIQTKNNYDIPWIKDDEEGTGIFNGDIGILQKIDRVNARLEVRFEDRVGLYTAEQAGDLELAYAMTIHKSQGSEFECVILPIMDVSPKLSYRNLLYTAVTRAKKQLIIVGVESAVYSMVDNNRRTLRYTRLAKLLEEGMK